MSLDPFPFWIQVKFGPYNKIYFYINKILSAHHIYCIFKSINEVSALDDERDISDFSDSSNDDFQKFLPFEH